MGETFAEVILRNNSKQIKKKLLVDTGATYSWIDAKVLKTLGVEPAVERTFETIEGKFIKRKICFIDIECLGEKAPTAVVFAIGKDSEVLGLHALEGLALEVDPVNRRLKKSRAIKAL